MTKLSEMIESSGLTRYEIAKRAGIAWSSLDKYVQGKSPVSSMPLSTAYKLAKVLGITADQLYSDATEPIDEIEIKEGWNEFPSFDFYVENGVITNGTVKDHNGQDVPAHPYEYTGNNEWKAIDPISVKDYIKLARQSKVIWQ